MTAPMLEHTLAGEQTANCTRCDSQLVTTSDAIGRTRVRCPKCDRVAPARTPHIDDAYIPQGLVRVQMLPAIAAGQLRCQRCARGVEGNARTCVACARRATTGTNAARVYKARQCAKCPKTFMPTGPRAQFCEACR